jgi:hypothetical protein
MKSAYEAHKNPLSRREVRAESGWVGPVAPVFCTFLAFTRLQKPGSPRTI